MSDTPIWGCEGCAGTGGRTSCPTHRGIIFSDEAPAAPRIAELERQLAAAKAARHEAESILASATDLANSWARDSGIAEAPMPRRIKEVIDDLWGYWSTRWNAEKAAREKAERAANLLETAYPVKLMAAERALIQAEADLATERARLTFRRLQDEQKPWVAHNFAGRHDYFPLLGAVEELGELAHAHLKQAQGIRGTPAELEALAQDAIADIVIFLSDYCTARGFDFQALMEETWAKVKQRDWKADPLNGCSAIDDARAKDSK